MKLLILVVVSILLPSAAAHEPAGTPKNFCEGPEDWREHDYAGVPGPDGFGIRISLSDLWDGILWLVDTIGDFFSDLFPGRNHSHGIDGNVSGDCNGDGIPADYDGHHEWAPGGAGLLADSGDGVTGGSLACYGEAGHHPRFGPFWVTDVIVGNAVVFRVGADRASLIPPTEPGKPDCGDFSMEDESVCAGACSVTFPPGLDGAYRISVEGTAGHVVS